MTKDKTATERTARYKASQLAKGLIKLAIWIPIESKNKFIDLAEKERNNKTN